MASVIRFAVRRMNTRLSFSALTERLYHCIRPGLLSALPASSLRPRWRARVRPVRYMPRQAFLSLVAL
jgi:hypothetical protein